MSRSLTNSVGIALIFPRPSATRLPLLTAAYLVVNRRAGGGWVTNLWNNVGEGAAMPVASCREVRAILDGTAMFANPPWKVD